MGIVVLKVDSQSSYQTDGVNNYLNLTATILMTFGSYSAILHYHSPLLWVITPPLGSRRQRYDHIILF